MNAILTIDVLVLFGAIVAVENLTAAKVGICEEICGIPKIDAAVSEILN